VSLPYPARPAAPKLDDCQVRSSRERSTAVITPSNAEALNLAQELRFYLDLLSQTRLKSRICRLSKWILSRVVSASGNFRGTREGHLADAAGQAQNSDRLCPVRCCAFARPERLLNYCLMLKIGEEMSPEMIREFLFESGYVEDDPVTDPGEFSLAAASSTFFRRTWKARAHEFFGIKSSPSGFRH